MKPQTHFETPQCGVYTIGPLVVMRVDGGELVSTMNALDEAFSTVMKTQRKAVFLAVVDNAVPDKRLSASSADLSSKYREVMLGAAIVRRNKGLGSVVLRSVIAGYSLLVREAMPMQVFSDYREGVAWLKTLDTEGLLGPWLPLFDAFLPSLLEGKPVEGATSKAPQ